jgi:hypothetical protein
MNKSYEYEYYDTVSYEYRSDFLDACSTLEQDGWVKVKKYRGEDFTPDKYAATFKRKVYHTEPTALDVSAEKGDTDEDTSDGSQ